MSRLLLLSSPHAQVTQVDLENILTYDAQIARLQRQRDDIAAGVLGRLAAGAAVEPGPRTVDIEVTYSGRFRKQRLNVW